MAYVPEYRAFRAKAGAKTGAKTRALRSATV
jgi:hypothetical protein